jgi:tRNA (guanine37-N1)-methyltransferase
MKFDILTLFPGMFSGPFDESIIWRAREKQLIDIDIHNIRDWATDRHQTTDDAPYGGGAGMVMKAGPLTDCIESVKALRPGSTVVLTSPRGRRLTHQVATELAALDGLIIVCGRYEGIDERVRTLCIQDDISIGDFVLSGGEIAAMAIVDSVTRLIPEALGNDESAESDSFCDGLLEYPHYTRPPEFRELTVPEVLLSGNHELIRKWRRRESLRSTIQLRPDLMTDIVLTKEDRKLLAELERDDVAACC